MSGFIGTVVFSLLLFSAPRVLGQKNQTPSPDAEKKFESLEDVISFTTEVNPKEALPGKVVTLKIIGTMAKGWHTNAINKITEDQIPPDIQIEENPAFQPIWPMREGPTKLHTQGKFKSFVHYDKVVWEQDIFIKPEAKSGPLTLKIKIAKLQVCKGICLGGPTPKDFMTTQAEIKVKEGKPVEVSNEVKERLKVKKTKPEVVSLSEAPGAVGGIKPGNTTTENPSNVDTTNLGGLLASAFFGAFFMLLTPCVFPMIPITVNFFLKQSEKEHHNPLLTALIYCGTIIIVLTLVVLAFGKVVTDWATNPWFNLALGAVLVFFALSLFGMYEIELPSSLARFTSAKEGQGGYLGAVFMALTFTITSFTCTGPFLGIIMAPIANFQPPLWQLALAAFVYSATFAAPFFVLALFPSMLKKLPKSGGWMNSIKVTMGFLELGAALKFLANTDMALNIGDPKFLNNDTVLCAWIALSVACGLYLLGLYRLPHDDANERIGVMRLMFASFFLGFALYLTPMLYGKKPDGIISKNVVAFLPQPFKTTSTATGTTHEALVWHRDFNKAWEIAKKENKHIFIDFTGVTCPNCRDNEENVFPLPQVQEELKKYVLLQLYTDWVPDSTIPRDKAYELGERNKDYQISIAGLALPTYLVYKPDPNIPLGSDGKVERKLVLGSRNGLLNVEDFVNFLKEHQNGQVKVSQLSSK